jgi:cell division protein FtsL
MQQAITVNNEEIPFYQYISRISSDYTTMVQQLNTDYTTNLQQLDTKYNQQKKRFKFGLIGSIAASVVATLLTVGICIAVCIMYKHHTNTQVNEAYQQMDAEVNAAHKELDEFKQKFEHVEPYNNGNLTLKAGFVEANDLQINESNDVKNSVNLQFSLQWNGEYYGAKITRNTQIIVILKDGSVKEYALRESSFTGKNSDIHLGVGNVFYYANSTWSFPVHELIGVNLEDISYIKLSGLDIWVQEEGSYRFKVIGTGYEVPIIYFPF